MPDLGQAVEQVVGDFLVLCGEARQHPGRVAAAGPGDDSAGGLGGTELFRERLELGVDGAVLVAEEYW
ncbi:hypothetical protein [Streptomyces durhamensis]|uniref:hypothetical protein n=1 Tax=Streptomyces durhamensis TaxID=68194 RepID=UPI001FD7FF38|nr:hypothetical protein [Streptomyces durhamensis]